MGRLHSGQVLWFVVPAVLFLGGCGGSKPQGASPFPVKITLNPATSTSLQQGSILTFTVSAQNNAGSTISPAFLFASDNPGVLTLSPTGLACAGTWNAPLYTICAPAGVGVANVTASALGETSPPTKVYVHQPIDNIQISLAATLNSPPPACPTQVALPAACNIPFNTNNCKPDPNRPGQISCACYSQNQVQNFQAQAFSQGSDITASVGPFTWSETDINVVTVTPTLDLTTNITTNQATATPNVPGETQVFASASGVSSQPYPFETCPVQCIDLEVGTNTNQTSFVVNQGTTEVITATAVDVQGCVVPKPPLTWTSSQPSSVLAGSATTGCAAGTTCDVTTPAAGAASITASCTPPSCNVGFPLNLLALAPPLVPQPVYPVTAISGLVTPATSSGSAAPTFSVLAASQDCAANAFCSVALYDISTSKNTAGNAIQLPAPPNSLIFDPAGDKAYLGSQYGAAVVAAANLGTGTGAFTTLPAAATPTGKVTGKALATSPDGSAAIFSDTISIPNQVYVVNTASSTAPSTTALNISGATTAAFSPDGLKAFISGTDSLGNSKLFVYSAQQALQSYSSAPTNAITFSSSGAFAFLVQGSASSAGTIAVRNVCDNSTALTFPITATPALVKTIPPAVLPISVSPSPADGLNVLLGLDKTSLDILVTTAMAPPLTALCPQSAMLPATLTLGTASLPNPARIDIGQGSFTPINFFLSPDSTQVYVVASDRSSVLVYSFTTGAVSAIPLANSITGQTVLPVSADITPDGALIYVATSDGTLHEISTTSGDSTDLTQIPFPPLPNSTNGFCVNGDSPISCILNLVVVRP